MNSAPPDLPPSAPARRSFFVTAAGLLLILIGGVLSLPGIFAILNLIVGGYGSKTFELSGFVIIVLGPFILIGTGIGLLLRWKLARFSLLLLLAAAIIGSGLEMLEPPRPEETIISPSGLKTTILASEASSWPIPLMVFSAGMGAVFLSRRVRDEF